MVKSTLYQYHGPLGWPAVNPGKVDSYDVETNQYTRTIREQSVTSYGDSIQQVLSILGVGADAETYSTELVKALEYRRQLDTYWEKLSAKIVYFTETYGSINSGKFKISDGTQIDDITIAVTEMQGWISNIEKILEKLGQNENVIKYLTGQNYINEMFVGYDASADDFSGVSKYYTYETLQETPTMAISLPVASTLNPFEDEYKAIYNTTTWADVNNLFAKYKSWVTSAQETVLGQIKEGYSDYAAIYPKKTVLGEREERLQKFKQDAYLLDSLLNDTNTRSVWVFLQIGNITFSTWDKSNYITDFNYKKNGSGTANSFTFNLAYAPPPGDTNINILEKITQKRRVFFQYGYNETEISSPQYCGWILSYTVKVENNVLKYSIVGYSDLSSVRNQLIDVEGFGTTNEASGESTGIRATEYAKSLLVTHLTPLGYVVKFSPAVQDFYDNKEKEVVIPAMPQVTLYEAIETVLGLVEERDTTDTAQESEESGESKAETQSGTDKIFTFYVDDSVDSDNQKTVTIDYIKSTKELDQSADITPALAFSWGGDFNGVQQELNDVGFDFTIYDYNANDYAVVDGTRNYYKQSEVNGDFNLSDYVGTVLGATYTKGKYQMLANLVVSFETQYKGEVTLARTYNGAKAKKRFDDEGNLVEVNDLESKYITGEYSIQDENYSYLIWEKNTQFSYDATLTLIGIPTDIPIGTYVYIKPIVNGVAHHTAGYYFISGADDTVSSGSFTTVLKLTKIIDVDADSVFKVIKEKKVRRAKRTKEEIQLERTKDRL